MNADAPVVSPQALEHRVFASIPLACAMQIRIADYDGARLTLAAPFAPNVNHAGIAFGGALECLGTLACWGLLWLLLADPEAAIVIQRGETQFRAPLAGALRASAEAPGDEELAHCRDALARHGRARIALRATVAAEGASVGAEFRGRFAVSRPGSAQHSVASAAKASSRSKR